MPHEIPLPLQCPNPIQYPSSLTPHKISYHTPDHDDDTRMNSHHSGLPVPVSVTIPVPMSMDTEPDFDGDMPISVPPTPIGAMDDAEDEEEDERELGTSYSRSSSISPITSRADDESETETDLESESHLHTLPDLYSHAIHSASSPPLPSTSTIIKVTPSAPASPATSPAPLPHPQQPAEDELVAWVDWQGHAPPPHTAYHFIAEKVCEMICYLWFSSSISGSRSARSRARRRQGAGSSSPVSNNSGSTSGSSNVNGVYMNILAAVKSEVELGAILDSKSLNCQVGAQKESYGLHYKNMLNSLCYHKI